jgi:GTP pyrophosphokinase
MGEAKREIEELAFSYSDPSEYNRLKKILKTRNGAGEKKMKTVLAEVEAALKKDHIKYEISGRTKSVYSLYKKLVKNPIDKIYDLSAMRIIVETVDECYRVLGILHRLFIPLEGRIKDYIAQPKPNGYQSLHTTVMTYDDNDAEFIVEFQIRTREMHEFAEHGLAASFHYNEAKLTDAYKKRAIAPLPDNLKWIQELQKIAIDIKNGRGGDVEKMKIKLFDDTIFVRSPKGDIYDLPAGSKPLDFAYRVHSDLGNTSAAFKINGKIADFDTELRDGDVVEIITRRNIRPRLDWIKKVFTPKARQKIKHQLKEDGVDVTRPKAPKRLKKKIKPTD